MVFSKINKKEVLGIDFGNVIIDHVSFGTTKEFVESGNYNEIPPMPNAFDTIRLLNEERFKGNIFVLFKATDVADHKIISWIKHHKFCEYTGIPSNKIIRNMDGRDKSRICLEYGATHFIDDRLEVLSFLVDVVPNLYLFKPRTEEVGKFKSFLDHVVNVDDWKSLREKIL